MVSFFFGGLIWPSLKLYIVVIACPFLFVIVVYRTNVSMVRALYPAEYMRT